MLSTDKDIRPFKHPLSGRFAGFVICRHRVQIPVTRSQIDAPPFGKVLARIDGAVYSDWTLNCVWAQRWVSAPYVCSMPGDIG